VFLDLLRGHSKDTGRHGLSNIVEGVAQWVSVELQKSLTKSNIKAGFRSTRIWPFNSAVVNQYMTHSQQFIQTNNVDDNEEDSDLEEEHETGLEGTD
jgi:hypothetical protein